LTGNKKKEIKNGSTKCAAKGLMTDHKYCEAAQPDTNPDANTGRVAFLRIPNSRHAIQESKNTMKRFSIAIIIIAACACSTGVLAKNRPFSQWNGEVTHVTDGDTLWVRPAGGGEAVKIRLDGIDAPEICQAYGNVSRTALTSRVLHHNVNVQGRSRDKYGRVIARVFNGSGGSSDDVGDFMVSQGHAWAHHYKRYPSTYGAQEAQARAEKRGLFAEPGAKEPSVFRKAHGSCH
jgi:micrococcal nuclease